MCSSEGDSGGISGGNTLASFFIEQARYNEIECKQAGGNGIECKRAGGNGIERDDEGFIRWRKTGSENEDNVFIGNSDVNFRELESNMADICNPGLN